MIAAILAEIAKYKLTVAKPNYHYEIRLDRR